MGHIETGELKLHEEALPDGLESREAFEAFAETLRPRWAERARAARELLYGLESEEGAAITAGEVLRERVRPLRLGGKVLEELGERTNAEGWRHNAYRVAITSSGRQLFSFTYCAGLALDRPGMVEILEAALNDVGYLESEPEAWSEREAAKVSRRRELLEGAVGADVLRELVEIAGQA